MKYVITVKANEVCATICSINLASNGDIHIEEEPSKYYREDPGSYKTDEEFIYYRTTIHCSRSSCGNLITNKKKFIGNKDERRLTHFTLAVKNGNFAFVYAKLLNDDYRFHSKYEKYKNINFGEIDERKFSLIYGVFVSARDSKFKWYDGTGVLNYIELPIGDFKLVVTWTFLEAPSIPLGWRVTNTTTDPKYVKDVAERRHIEAVMLGMEFEEVACQFPKITYNLLNNRIMLTGENGLRLSKCGTKVAEEYAPLPDWW